MTQRFRKGRFVDWFANDLSCEETLRRPVLLTVGHSLFTSDSRFREPILFCEISIGMERLTKIRCCFRPWTRPSSTPSPIAACKFPTVEFARFLLRGGECRTKTTGSHSCTITSPRLSLRNSRAREAWRSVGLSGDFVASSSPTAYPILRAIVIFSAAAMCPTRASVAESRVISSTTSSRGKRFAVGEGIASAGSFTTRKAVNGYRFPRTGKGPSTYYSYY